MNAEPHIHELDIRDRGDYWAISYGDQTMLPDKSLATWFGLRSEQEALAGLCRKIIRQHDRESIKAGQRRVNTSAIAYALQPRARDRWGSEQT